MGTNFYWKDMPEIFGAVKDYSADDMRIHLGKRSMAGLYCYDCGTTLHRYGTQYVHSAEEYHYEQCPLCGKQHDRNYKGDTSQPVRGACSFSWTAMIHRKLLEAIEDKSQKLIVDEYGTEYTVQEFLDEVDDCPIIFQTPGEFS